MNTIIRQFIFLAALWLCGSPAFAQNYLQGSVTSEKRGGVSSATIQLNQKGKITSAIADEAGSFEFKNLHTGTYDVLATAVGYNVYVGSIVVSSGMNTLHITLYHLSNELQAIEVTGTLAKKYNSDYSFSATRTSALNKEIPQAITTVTKELMADRQTFQLADAVKIASGVAPSSYYNQYAIRGISQNEEGQIINGMRTRQYYFLQPLTANIERVEVIKGPASATFASVDPGGSINLVTKKPLAINRRELSFSAGSFNTIRGTLDFTGPLNNSKTLLYRLNAAYQEAKSYRDLVRNNSFIISPSISYIPTDKTAINVEMIWSSRNGNLDRGQPIFGAVAGVTHLNSTPISLNLGAPNDFFKSKELMVTTNFSHRFSKHITFNAAYMKQTWTEDLQEHRTTNAFGVDTANAPQATLAAMQWVQRQQFWNVDNLNAYFNFLFHTGAVTHEMLAGYDYSGWEKTKGGVQNSARGFLLKDGSVASAFVKANAANYQLQTIGGVVMPKPNVAHFDLQNPAYILRNVNDYVLNSKLALPAALTINQAVYVQDQIRWNKFIVLLSLRQEWFKDITNYKSPHEGSFTNAVLLPRVGITYSINAAMNVYATYLKGFQPQSNTVTLMPNTGSFYNTAKSAALFKPLESDLKELGVKMDLLKGKIKWNAAVYEINQKNLLMNANVPAFPDSLTTRGAERSRGFETDIAGFILPNWQVNASYSYINARIVEDNDKTLIGARKQNTPIHSGNVWTRYNFPKETMLKDVGLGLGLQYSGSKVPWFNRQFEVPAYTLVDAAVYYTPANSHLQLALHVNNVTGKTYWIGAQNYQRLFPGAPRNIMLTATYKF